MGHSRDRPSNSINSTGKQQKGESLAQSQQQLTRKLSTLLSSLLSQWNIYPKIKFKQDTTLYPDWNWKMLIGSWMLVTASAAGGPVRKSLKRHLTLLHSTSPSKKKKKDPEVTPPLLASIANSLSRQFSLNNKMFIARSGRWSQEEQCILLCEVSNRRRGNRMSPQRISLTTTTFPAQTGKTINCFKSHRNSPPCYRHRAEKLNNSKVRSLLSTERFIIQKPGCIFPTLALLPHM